MYETDASSVPEPPSGVHEGRMRFTEEELGRIVALYLRGTGQEPLGSETFMFQFALSKEDGHTAVLMEVWYTDTNGQEV